MENFVPRDFDVPQRLETPQFLLEPLDPEHNDQDYDGWPREMTPDENRSDLQRHAHEAPQAAVQLNSDREDS